MVTYKSAGVNIDAGNELVSRIKKMVPGIGGFSGAYPLYLHKYKQPLLVSSSDGVGTKLKLAFMLNLHSTIGIDLVAMNVNDIICCGAEPLFFLDYFACGKLQVNQAEEVIKGIVKGCELAGCVLLGGETAEMPGFYKKGEYDIAGFSVGAVEKSLFIDGKKIKPGDLILGLPSSGLHSNGFSLVRKIFSGVRLKQYATDLIKPTRIYCKEMFSLIRRNRNLVHGIVHITGGGFYDNIPRILPKNCRAVINCDAWDVPDIFRKISFFGSVGDHEMYRTFNMGIGMIVVTAQNAFMAIKKKIPDIKKIGYVEKSGRKGQNAQNVELI